MYLVCLVASVSLHGEIAEIAYRHVSNQRGKRVSKKVAQTTMQATLTLLASLIVQWGMAGQAAVLGLSAKVIGSQVGTVLSLLKFIFTVFLGSLWCQCEITKPLLRESARSHWWVALLPISDLSLQ